MEWLKGFLAQDQGIPASPGIPSRIGKYEVISEVARGGSSVVYEGRDRELGRRVALKVLKGDSAPPTLIARLHREATAAAQLRHPHIVAIHEVGTVLNPDGSAVHFIALDFIEGTTLTQALPRMNARERIEVLAVIARTVAFAHGQGVVHRDLKPENVLVEETPEVPTAGPRFTVWLTDFGLAKMEGGEDLTRTGSVIGTPHYMAPEQVRGRVGEMGPSTDVWALGVMLYEAIAGRRPFEGRTALEIYQSIISHEPIRPRSIQPLADRDLETIALKALERRPEARYPSATEMADDLDRYLRGEPISMRPTGIFRRLTKRVSRNPIPVASGSAIALALTLALALGLWGRVERRQGLSAMRDKARLSLEAALALRRTGANAEMRGFMAPLEEAYHAAKARDPHSAELDYLMGRMCRALLESDRALQYQESALENDPSYGPALYEHVVLLLCKRARKVGRFRESGDGPSAGDDRAHPELRGLSEAALKDGRDLAKRGTDFLSPGQRAVLEGARAYGRHEWSAATKALEDALKLDPLLDEAWDLLGAALREQAVAESRVRESNWEKVIQTYTEGLARDRGYVPHLMSRSWVYRIQGNYLQDRGLDPTRNYDRALEDLDRVLALVPTSYEASFMKGVIGCHRGSYRSRHGNDPEPDFQSGEADLARAARLADARSLPFVLSWQGTIHYHRGCHLSKMGRDPMDEFSRSETEFSAALASDPTQSDAKIRMARLQATRATWRGLHGQDASEEFAQADSGFTRSLAHDPNNSWTLTWQGTERIGKALFMAARGEDAMPDLARAEECLIRAIRAAPDHMEALQERLRLRCLRAELFEKAGNAVRAIQDYSDAASDGVHAISLNPALARELSPMLDRCRKRASALKP